MSQGLEPAPTKNCPDNIGTSGSRFTPGPPSIAKTCNREPASFAGDADTTRVAVGSAANDVSEYGRSTPNAHPFFDEKDRSVRTGVGGAASASASVPPSTASGSAQYST